MVEFGVLSSIFDLLTFGILLMAFHSSVSAFRTGWFVESLLTELVIALVVRTRRPSWSSRPGSLLLGLTCVLVPGTILLPYLPFAGVAGLIPLPPGILILLLGVVALYVASAELLKRWFYRA
jgi:Mg2+-importing ATPase